MKVSGFWGRLLRGMCPGSLRSYHGQAKLFTVSRRQCEGDTAYRFVCGGVFDPAAARD